MRFAKRKDRGAAAPSRRRSLHRAAGVTGAMLAGVFSLGVAGAPTAQAAPQDATWTLTRQATDPAQCLTAEFSLPGVSMAYCNGTPAQHWNVHTWKDGTRELKSVRYGQCLDDSLLGVRTFPCNATPFQSWYVHRWNDGTLQLKNQATGRCLDGSAAHGLRTYECNASRFQSWH